MGILVPVDGSDCSLRAVSHVIAALIAARKKLGPGNELDLRLANVQVALPGGVGEFVSPEQIAGFHHDESEKALASARRLLDEAAIRYQAHAEVGSEPQKALAGARIPVVVYR